MLEIFVYLSVATLLTLVIAYLYVEAQRRKAIVKKNKAIINCVASMKSKFNEQMKRLVERKVITVKQHKILYRIANNFFVFQPVSSKSIEFCEYSLNNVVGVMPQGGPDSLHFEKIQKQVNVYVRKLPAAANGFNANFYRNELPKLNKQLVDAIDNIYKVESELSDLSEHENATVDSSSSSEAA